MTTSNAAAGSMQSEINMAPMIDVLLVLLILFMVIVPPMPNGETACAPPPAIDQVHAPQNPVVLQILRGVNGNAEFRINRQEVSRQNLPARLAAIYANRAQRVIFIKGDDQLSFTQVAEVIDISHTAGIDQVGLITPKASRGL